MPTRSRSARSQPPLAAGRSTRPAGFPSPAGLAYSWLCTSLACWPPCGVTTCARAGHRCEHHRRNGRRQCLVASSRAPANGVLLCVCAHTVRVADAFSASGILCRRIPLAPASARRHDGESVTTRRTADGLDDPPDFAERHTRPAARRCSGPRCLRFARKRAATGQGVTALAPEGALRSRWASGSIPARASDATLRHRRPLRPDGDGGLHGAGPRRCPRHLNRVPDRQRIG